MGDVINNKKIRMVVSVSIEDIAGDLVDECSIEELIDFIGVLDYKLEDVEFVEQVYAWASKAMKEEGLI